MKKYLIALIILLIASVAFGNASNLTRVTDADMKTAILRAGMTLDDFGGVAPVTSGTPYYVDSVNGANNRSGKSWDLPVASIDTAINLISAARTAGTEKGRSIIYVREQHNEGGTATGTIYDADIDGITIYGLGRGSDMPTIDFDYTSSTCVYGADNIVTYNIRFRASTDAITKGVETESGADYPLFIGCEWTTEDATDEFAILLNIGTSTGAEVFDCHLDSGSASAVTGITFEAATGLRIAETTIRGRYSTSNINNAITLATKVMIEDNYLENASTTIIVAQPVVELMATTTGTMRNNDGVCDVATQNLAWVGTLMFNRGNSYNESQGGAYTAWDADMAPNTNTASILETVGG